jgi:hypothetical protein
MDRVPQFLLRRCAELTLEKGHRWFSLGSQVSVSAVTGASKWMAPSSHREATVRLLNKETDDPAPFDSVVIIHETDESSGGRLSEKARWRLRAASGKCDPLGRGRTLVDSAGVHFGQVVTTEMRGDLFGGRVDAAVFVRLARRPRAWAWVSLDQACQMVTIASDQKE